MEAMSKNGTYLKISKAIEFISKYHLAQPSLKNIADYVCLSEYHLQRLFSQWVGVSPKQFLMYQTKQYAKQCLKQSTVLAAALDSGLSGAGRLHDLMLTCEGVTPGEYKKQGGGLVIHYGIHESPFGYCLLAATARGICKMSFFDTLADSPKHVDELKLSWVNARIVADEYYSLVYMDKLFNRDYSKGDSVHLLLKGTSFQLRVWEALLTIPESSLCSYQQLALSMGAPSSVRSVATAIGKNNLAYLIPCHRVIKSTGEFNKYRWGESRKAAMIISEAAGLTEE